MREGGIDWSMRLVAFGLNVRRSPAEDDMGLTSRLGEHDSFVRPAKFVFSFGAYLGTHR